MLGRPRGLARLRAADRALALFGLGRRVRAGAGGHDASASPSPSPGSPTRSRCTRSGSSFNDGLVALLVVASLLVLSSPPARGAVVGPGRVDQVRAARAGAAARRRDRGAAAAAAARSSRSPSATAALVTIPLLLDGGLHELYDRSLGYQAARGSPFSVWGQAPSLEPLQTPQGPRRRARRGALLRPPATHHRPGRGARGSLLIAVQVTATHWFYPYAVWFAPLALVAFFAQRRGPEPAIQTPAARHGFRPSVERPLAIFRHRSKHRGDAVSADNFRHDGER